MKKPPSPELCAHILAKTALTVIFLLLARSSGPRSNPPCLRRFSGWALLLILLHLASISKAANTNYVQNVSDSGDGSLRECIEISFPGDVVAFSNNFNNSPLAIVLTSGELGIGRDLTIIGPPRGVIIDAANASRIFNISAGNVTISGVQMSNGFVLGTDGNGCGENGATVGGGGILNTANLTLVNCTITQCSAEGGTGGSCPDPSFPNYSGDGGLAAGGGIWNQGTLNMQNCTMYGNVAEGGLAGQPIDPDENSDGSAAGGAICNQGTLTMQGCTIVGNGAEPEPYTCGGIYNQASTFTFGNCIIANNVGSAPDMRGMNEGFPILIDNEPTDDPTITDLGFNLVSRDDGWDGYLSTDLVGTSAAPWDPLLGPLQDNGGQTPTMAPLPGSPVIDEGSSLGLTTDQRGKIRPFRYYPNTALPEGGDGSDIGACELTRTGLQIKVIANLGLGYLTLMWLEDSAATGANNIAPYSGVIFSQSGFSGPGMWMPLMTPVRYINHMFMTRDVINPPGVVLVSNAVFYQTLGPSTGTNYYFPAVTTAATQITSSGAALNGTTIPIGLGTLYWFIYGSDTNYGQSTATNSIGTSSNQTPLTQLIGGLSSSSTCHFQLMVTDDWGTQYGGDQSFTTLAPPPPAPSMVTYAASSITTNGAVLNASMNGHGQADAGYFQYGLDTNYGNLTYSNQVFGTGNLQNYSNTISGLTASTTYHYQAIGTSMGGLGYGQDMFFTTATAPPAVVTLAASSITHATATLNGTVNPNAPTSTVYFKWGINTSYGNTTPQTGVNSSESFNASISGLSANSTYHFRIVALNSGGTNSGADASFTTPGD